MSESVPGGAARARILVGVDGSADGIRAVRYAMGEALVSDCDLWIVNVVDDEAMVSGLWDLLATADVLRQAGADKVGQALDVLANDGFPLDRVKSEVLVGRPGDVLAELSRQARLLVVGRRSISGLERMFVGSTSVSVVSRAACPVIVISAAATPHRTGEMRTVALAVSTWPLQPAVLEWATREAGLRKARLRVVHVVPETLGVEGAGFVAAASRELENQIAPLREAHPEAAIEVETLLGTPVEALVEVSRSVDLLILGLNRRSAGLGGSVRGVIAHAHCPVGITPVVPG